MLIVNHDQLRLAGMGSLDESCRYCSKTLAAYPLIMSDDEDQTVYHLPCALELATEIMVDLFTFFSPPAPYTRLYVLEASEAPSDTKVFRQQGGKYAVNEPAPN